MNAKLKQEIEFINTEKKIHLNCCNFLFLGNVKFTEKVHVRESERQDRKQRQQYIVQHPFF